MSRTRAEINRANAKKSTGPKTAEGKARSSAKSFQHGLYSSEVVVRGEEITEYNQVLSLFQAEHQPGTITEEVLVEKLAQHYWRECRYRRLEQQMWNPPDVRNKKGEVPVATESILACEHHGFLQIVERSMAAAERSFYKALTTLRKLQANRGFVPAKPISTTSQPVNSTVQAAAASGAAGSVPSLQEEAPIAAAAQDSAPARQNEQTPSVAPGFVSSNAVSDRSAPPVSSASLRSSNLDNIENAERLAG